MANIASIANRFGLNEESRAVSWLPPFHDMGLVGGILTPLATGVPVRLLAPETVLLTPLSWLKAVRDFRAGVSGGPNFAYDLCVRRAASPDSLEGLDLSGWEVAFNGAERVQADTLRRFAATFAPAGFEPSAFFPCYGLAEATLMVTAGRYVPPARSANNSDAPVPCGPPVPGVDLRVVDFDRTPAREVETGEEGELWVAGECVTDGYWSGDDDELFGELDGRRYLRTGDLGRLESGGLVVTGRIKDLLVHRGSPTTPRTSSRQRARSSVHGWGRRRLPDGGPRGFPQRDGRGGARIGAVGTKRQRPSGCRTLPCCRPRAVRAGPGRGSDGGPPVETSHVQRQGTHVGAGIIR